MGEQLNEAPDPHVTAWRVASAIITGVGICSAMWMWIACPCTRIETWGYGIAEAGFVVWLLGASIGIVGAKGDRAVYVAALIAAPIAAVATMGMAVSH